MRACDVGLRVRVRSGTHACFVGEETALRALGDGCFQSHTKAAADDGLGREGIPEDHGEGRGNVSDARCENYDTAENEDDRHDRDDLLSDGSQAIHTADENDCTDHDQDDADDPGRNAESRLESGTDGVGLHHAAEESQSEDDRNGEESGQEPAKRSLERSGDVVNGTALNAAVFVPDPRLLCENSFRIDSRHSEEGDDPHPEDRARSACQNSAGSPDDIAGSDLGRDRGGERLEGAHPALMLFAVERDISEYTFHPFSKESYLDKSGPDRVPETDQDQQKDQHIIRRCHQ